MLVQISGQIERLQGSVEQVLAKMDAARLGKIDAALGFLAQIDRFRPENRTPMLLNAVQKLSDVLGEAWRDVQQGVAAVPEPPEWNISRALWDTSDDTARALDRAALSMRTVLLCLRALGQAQSVLNGEEAAASIMRDELDRVLSLPLGRAEHLARRLPIVKEEQRRDRFWIDTRQALERAREKIEEMLDPDRPLVAQFEARGAQFIDALEQHALPGPTAPADLRADPAARLRP